MRFPWQSRTRQKQPTKRQRLRQRRRRRIALLVGGVLVLLVGGGIGLMHLSALHIDTVQVRGAQALDADALTTDVRSQLAGAYGYIIPRRNTLVYPKNTIRRQLQQQYPRIKTLTLDRSGLNALTVRVSEHSQHGAWCGRERPATTSPTRAGECYFVTEAGALFAEAPAFSGTVYTRLYGDLTSGTSHPGRGQYLSPETFRRLTGILDDVQQLEYEPIAVTLPNTKDVHVHLASGAFLKVDRTVSRTRTQETLEATLEAQAFRRQQQNPQQSLRYIDLRFGDRVYYKFEE